MLGVSQPGNPPSSLRHSASFSCLQRGTASEGHRARTSTLLQQPSLQLSNSHHQYTAGQAASSLLQQSTGTVQHRIEALEAVQDAGNDYGFVKLRPRLRSTNATLHYEEELAAQKNAIWDRDASAFSDRECDGNYRDPPSLKIKDNREHSPKGAANSKNQNPLRGALILFTSTSSWWKARQREDQLNAGDHRAFASTSSGVALPSSERKWSSTSMASPSNERKWPSVVTSPTNDRKWSNNNALTSPGNERKWTRSSVSSSTNSGQQDRKWRSLGALLRAPTAATPASHAVHHSLSHNMSVSMIEGDHFREDARGSACKSTRYQQPTSDTVEERHARQFDEECRGRANRESICKTEQQQQAVNEGTRGSTTTTTRSNRAQSFYLLDDFLRPQPQQGSSNNNNNNNNNKCMLNVYLSPSHAASKSTSGSNGNDLLHSAAGRSADQAKHQVSQGNANVTNITPPRRHNSSSDSLEVATSPLPPPVPPPPPQVTATRDRERAENLKEKDVCQCKVCWTNMQQQRCFVEETFIKCGVIQALKDNKL
ncbi:hypothetical protein APICC_09062 [Apis cerana cerana]|uniref:Uncharacterized protein n=1 Tax=Apis cerana cerana TaxID=94128 RepID=A0A2A3EEA4_APICC|nr:hypothetical protein APICC_09062 [Apis cerana cerana]